MFSFNTRDRPLIGIEFFTNQTGLTYTITGVSQSINGNIPSLSPTLTYHNNVLEACTVNYIRIDVESGDRSATQISISLWGVELSVYINFDFPKPFRGQTDIFRPTLHAASAQNTTMPQISVLVWSITMSQRQ
jgi:hypothetical protein